jgi:hypothetical protein
MIKFTERTAFTLVLLAFTALIFYITLGLGPVARLVPLRVVVVTLALILLQLLLDLFPQLTEKTYASTQTDPFKTEQIKGIDKGLSRHNHSNVQQEIPTFRKELRIFLWLLVIPTSIYLFGFFTAAPLYIFFSFKVWSREGWLKSIAAAIGLWSLLYVILHILLSIRLEGGIFWHLLP